MFNLRFLSVLSLAIFAAATPLATKRRPFSDDLVNLYVRTDDKNSSSNDTSLNNYGNLDSMKGFDDFNGGGNFDGSQNAQVIVVQEQQTVCQKVQIEIIQQKLIILQEMAKKIITELVCEVETQTIVIEQFQSGIVAFQKDVSRKTTKQVGFDQNIAGLSSKILNEDGSVNLDDLNFKGTDVGNSTVVPAGSNWNDDTSPESVQKALDAALKAQNSSSSTQ